MRFDFSFGDKLAPRLGATYDVRGDGRFKIFGSWGRYYDWTKYELPRGSYGGEFWQVYYRVARYTGHRQPQPEPTCRVGICGIRAFRGSFRDRRVPNFDSTDPDHPADVSGQHQRGDGIPVQHHVHLRRALHPQ